MNKKSKLAKSIRGKLISATCMLLVAMIMVVSSTYAWFTLSTAPEVTGISTAVGANGALEMLLLTKDASGNWVYHDGTVEEGTDVNTYWGNLVDVSGSSYGLDQIVLYPSQFGEGDGSIEIGSKFGNNMLATPEYGADGRVTGLTPDAIFGSYKALEENGTKAFYQDDDAFGVRGIGAVSGMSDRQLAYRNGLANAATAMSQAKSLTSSTLNVNGNGLASIAVAIGLGNEVTDYSALDALITDLAKDGGVINLIEKAYANLLLSLYASKANASDDTTWQTIKASVDSGDYDFIYTYTSSFIGIEKLSTTKANVASAQTATGNAKLPYLLETDTMTINGFTVAEIMGENGIDNFVQDFVEKGNGLTVTMPSGSGAFSDIADQCGDYAASVVVESVSYGTLNLTNIKAKMVTKTNVNPSYISQGITVTNASGAPESDAETVLPLTEFYGYILDLAFRTNAKDSDLLLQTEGVDRIYSDNANPLTKGEGSTMTFNPTTTEMDTAAIKSLMNSIRIVFFTPAQPGVAGAQNTVIAEARLDTAGATVNDQAGVVADIKIWNSATSTFSDSAKLLDLTQNQIAQLSVLVYLDGNSVENSDVAATAATSVTGSMNLQFSSSATLVPMEYGDLHIPGGADAEEGTTAAETSATTTEASGS